MAKRKRLTPAQPDHFAAAPGAPETKSLTGPGFAAPHAAPIAQVAGEAATRAALDEVSGVLRDARAEGRMIEALPLDAVEAAYLVRDRMVQDDDDMEALMASLRARGQQTPIEVTALPGHGGGGPAYGLISGWRRLTALRRLHEETGEARFATVKALVIAPESAQEAYVAMVEENEIRANLSLYERARIALRAAREGVYPTPRHAVLGLFASTPRAKRSKIGRFVSLVEALEGHLAFPTAIPEKLGLDLARALSEDAGLVKTLQARLRRTPPQSAQDEMKILSGIVAQHRAPKTPSPEPETDSVTGSGKGGGGTSGATSPAPSSGQSAAPTAPEDMSPGLQLRYEPGPPARIELVGERVDEALFESLFVWLAERGQGNEGGAN